MTVLTLCIGAFTLFVVALFMTLVLNWADRAFHVNVDKRIETIMDALPRANCGGCSFAGCSEYAKAVVSGDAPIDACSAGGPECMSAMAEIMNLDVSLSAPEKAIVHCRAMQNDRLYQSVYKGERRCSPANFIKDIQGCAYGCLGFGDCCHACNYDAVSIVDGLATVNYEKCVGCGACVRACPRNIISLVPFKEEKMVAVQCANHDFGKDVMAVCKLGCTGCKKCAKITDQFEIKDNLSVLDYDKYQPELSADLEKAIDKCPTGVIRHVGKK